MEQKLTDQEKIAMLAGYYLGAKSSNKKRRSKIFMDKLSLYGQTAFRAMCLGGYDNPITALETLKFFDENINVNKAI